MSILSMIDFSDMLCYDVVMIGVSVVNKKVVIQVFVIIVLYFVDVDVKLIVECLVVCEKLGLIGFGGGVVILYVKLEGFLQVIVVFVWLVYLIEFQVVDDLFVDLVFMLLLLVDVGVIYLKVFVWVLWWMCDQIFLLKLCGVGLFDVLYVLFIVDEVCDVV